jgi:hypothetical protein
VSVSLAALVDEQYQKARASEGSEAAAEQRQRAGQQSPNRSGARPNDPLGIR